MNRSQPPPSGPVLPTGLNHLVLRVRDLDRSHRFWSELLGFRQTGEWRATPERPWKFRFYSGGDERGLHHHHIGLREDDTLPPVEEAGPANALSHVAISYADRDAWLAQIRFLADNDVEIRRVDHGMTHSAYIKDPDGYTVEVVYDLPGEMWRHEIDDALNYYEPRPGDELVDRISHT
ncbi:MAG: catechol 2,3-dioxygenase-like lactoylglutathione lyase family enzyme [Candidatus Poriferisodalaceae bacterium]|jgi:catechol 2,3-dioxygenase